MGWYRFDGWLSNLIFRNENRCDIGKNISRREIFDSIEIEFFRKTCLCSLAGCSWFVGISYLLLWKSLNCKKEVFASFLRSVEWYEWFDYWLDLFFVFWCERDSFGVEKVAFAVDGGIGVF